jgi:hypothetical protein
VNRVVRIPHPRSGRPLSLPKNSTTISTLQTLHAACDLESPYVFPHTVGPKGGERSEDIKSGFTAHWHTRRLRLHLARPPTHFASWLLMRGPSLRTGWIRTSNLPQAPFVFPEGDTPPPATLAGRTIAGPCDTDAGPRR